MPLDGFHDWEHSVGCADLMKIGRPILTADALLQPIDFIELTQPSKQGLSKIICEMAEGGCSQREIARELNLSKTFVQSALAKDLKTKRRQRRVNALKKEGTFCFRSHASPYGFDCVNHRLVESPKELQNVKKIISLWNKGHGYRAIAQKLEQLNIKTRKGKRWDHSRIKVLILKALEKGNPYEKVGIRVRLMTRDAEKSHSAKKRKK